MKTLIVQIPAYNEEKTIAKVIKDIPRKIRGIDEVKVLVSDDHSTDNTIDEAEDAGADYILPHKHNQGLGRNFKHAIDKCLELGADIIVNIDADGQFNPKDIPKLIRPIREHEADMVTCSRFLSPEMTKNMPLLKRFGNKMFVLLINSLIGQKFSDTQCGFRAYSREAALRLNINGKFTYTQEVFIDLVGKNLKIKEIPLEVKYFEERKSHISSDLISYGLKSLGIIARATRDSKPLSFFGSPGIAIFLLGLLGAAFSFFYWLEYRTSSPVKTLSNVSTFFMIFGVSLCILGLMADMMKTLKRNQDEILYRMKKNEYKKEE